MDIFHDKIKMANPTLPTKTGMDPVEKTFASIHYIGDIVKTSTTPPGLATKLFHPTPLELPQTSIR
jgi:hypothetical protein